MYLLLCHPIWKPPVAIAICPTMIDSRMNHPSPSVAFPWRLAWPGSRLKCTSSRQPTSPYKNKDYFSLQYDMTWCSAKNVASVQSQHPITFLFKFCAFCGRKRRIIERNDEVTKTSTSFTSIESNRIISHLTHSLSSSSDQIDCC